MTYWNNAYGIGPVNEIGIRPTDAQMDSLEQGLLFQSNIGIKPNF